MARAEKKLHKPKRFDSIKKTIKRIKENILVIKKILSEK